MTARWSRPRARRWSGRCRSCAGVQVSGTWQRRGGRHSTATFTFFRINVPANTFAGTQTITEDIELSRDGNEFTATGTSEIRDASGNVIQTGCNSLTGNRID